MLEGLKRLFSGSPAPAHDWDEIARWAASRQHSFRGVRKAEGFVVEGQMSTVPWRIEWGPSQRAYIEGTELRLRAELGLPSELQVVVMNRVLQEQMEAAVFDQYVEGVQTRIDTETPPEMRWLVMFPKLAGAEMGALKERYVALSSVKPWLTQWLEGPLAAALAASAQAPDLPFVLMIGRGRLTLRMAQGDPRVRELSHALTLFETAMREARRVGNLRVDSGAASTQPSLWTSAGPPGEGGPTT